MRFIQPLCCEFRWPEAREGSLKSIGTKAWKRKKHMGWGERSILQTAECPSFSVPKYKEGQAGKLKWKQEKRKGS